MTSNALLALALLCLATLSSADTQLVHLKPSRVLDLVGNRADKNSVGAGKNVAVYTGKTPRFFYATHEMGSVFSAAEGETVTWYPDQVIIRPMQPAPGVTEERQICVLGDTVVARVYVRNDTDSAMTHRLALAGDCRGSRDWRGKPGGAKSSRQVGNAILLSDGNVFPDVFRNGLSIAIGGSEKPSAVDVTTPGAYHAEWELEIPPHATRSLTLACAMGGNQSEVLPSLRKALRLADPAAESRRSWNQFYTRNAPQFECSDAGLNELYAFRWFLLRFSTAGGDLGFFKYPVVMEGRQAFQTYCCYSAPFMAFDMNWLADPKAGWGHIATMAHAAYPDGRFPWYTSPRTNMVPLDHPSKTGLSLLPDALWKWYLIHGNKTLLAELYPAMKLNMEWWIKDRDPDGNGLFEIDHQLETGMDDLERRWKGPRPARYEAVDATTYALANLRAVASMARVLGFPADEARFAEYADRSEQALRTVLWDSGSGRFLDRNPRNGELSDYTAITIFYPLLSLSPAKDVLDTLASRYLFSPQQFWLAHPLPAISRADPEFDPVKRYWAGPSWPAATCHVIEGFARSAKQSDRSLLPRAAELLKLAARNHLQPRADFYERYDPFTGKPLSAFRDYMHSWWIDLFICHIAGMEPQEDGSLVIDPLPMGLERVALDGAPYRGSRIDVEIEAQGPRQGLTVKCNGRVVARKRSFKPGDPPVRIAASELAPKKS